MKIIASLFVVLLFGCRQPSSSEMPEKIPVNDPHSAANFNEVVTKHLDLDIAVNFDEEQISGKAAWTIDNTAKVDHIIFDTWRLAVERVTLGTEEKSTAFTLGKDSGYLGRPLEIKIDTGTTRVNIYYSTSREAGALQWLKPQQTAGKKLPFLFTQSQPILARSWVPCQDGPAVRFTYNATVRVPSNLSAVMSAENPQQRSPSGVYTFRQQKPIPSYLLALAVGDISFKAIDHRTGVYAEPSVIEKASWEFADMGKMVNAAEKLYGPYQWGRYDLIVLPPSFPYGGMENPMLTFATPTVIAGDRSLVGLVAHELAHSWSGNLVTNATWNDIWLNEGFTTYFENRIIEALYGKPEAKMQEVFSRQDLARAIKDLGETSMDTRLKLDLAGRDPDEGLGTIAYDKGFAFLRTIEETFGRDRFDAFLKDYFSKNAFQSRTTEEFLGQLNAYFEDDSKGLEKLRAAEWIRGVGIPSNMPAAVSPQFTSIDSLLKQWEATKQATGLSKLIVSTNQKLYFLRKLPSSITAEEMATLDKEFGFTRSGNAELQTAWYTIAIQKQYKAATPYIEKFLIEVGRRKFLRPLYGEMVKTAEGKAWAKQVYQKARPNYHPVAYNTIDDMLK
ncbi:MAG: Peptidase rane alanine aminopeptidase [Chitinophagaceae bacterium]|jgi:leukotriene A-4 hydrolase/aminopeptidase|nr:Peptidase rane alanine aminopeptidase [Chitinophagaceae bacterium]